MSEQLTQLNQQLVNSMHAVELRREAEALARLDDPGQSFPGFVYDTLNQAKIYERTTPDEPVKIFSIDGANLTQTLRDFVDTNLQLDPRNRKTPEARELLIINAYRKELKKTDVLGKLSTLASIAIIAASSKPEVVPESISTALAEAKPIRKAPKEAPTDKIFRCAIDALREEAFAKNLTTDEQTVQNELNKASNIKAYLDIAFAHPIIELGDAAASLINKKIVRGFAKVLIKHLLQPETTAADVNDEVHAHKQMLYRQHEARSAELQTSPAALTQPESQIEIVQIQGPVLPAEPGKSRESADEASERMPISEQRRADLKKLREIRETTVGDIVTAWGAGAFALEVIMGDRGGKPNYIVAVLPEDLPGGDLRIHTIAESLVPGAMYGTRGESLKNTSIDATSRETIVHDVEKLYKRGKSVLRDIHSAKRMYHRNGPRLFDEALDFLTKPNVETTDNQSNSLE